MSRVNELLAELAPNGVEYRALGEVAEFSTVRANIPELDATNYVGLDNLRPDFGGRDDATFSANSGGAIRFEPGDVLLGNIRPYLKKMWLADRHGGASPDVLCLRRRSEWGDRLLALYLYYALASRGFVDHWVGTSRGAKMPRGDKAAILSYRVPVPPLGVQLEIVRVLDRLTELESSLEVELRVEQDARRQQYASATQLLLEACETAPTHLIQDVCTRITSGGTPRSGVPEYYGGSIPWVRTGDVDFSAIRSAELTLSEAGLKNSAAKWIPAKSVIVAMIGATAGKVAYTEIDVTTNQNCCNLVIDPTVADYRYVYHWLRAHYRDLRALAPGAVSIINSTAIKTFPIAVPPLDEQRRIAQMLDSFNALVNDLSVGLLAELTARRQQHDYYRETLLALPEAA